MKDYHILVVDDQKEHRTFICDVLISEGYQPIEAENAEQAKKIILSEPKFDLFILDQMMYPMKGTELFRQICLEEKYRLDVNTPVIFITAYPEDREVYEIVQEGIIVLEKPIRDFNDILEAVAKLLESIG